MTLLVDSSVWSSALRACVAALCLIVLSLTAVGTSATVVIPCELGPKPYARLLAENRHAFIARIQSISWEERPGARPDHDYASGMVRATFKVLATIKGNTEEIRTLDQEIFGNPSSNPYLRVASDYLVFTNSGEVIPGACLRQARFIGYGNHDDLVQRLRRTDPDGPAGSR